MVTSEGNRVQTPVTTPFEREGQAFQPPPPPAQEFRGEPQAAAVADPFGSLSYVVAGATIGSMWGLAGLLLAIVGLSNVASAYLWAVAAIVLGAAFLALGTIDVFWAGIFRSPRQAMEDRERALFSSGVAAVWIAGIVSIVLGILNLVFVGQVGYTAVATIVLGAGLFWHSGVMRSVSNFTHEFGYRGIRERPIGPLAVNALSLAPLRDMLLGIGAMVLGVLAMLNVVPVTLTFVALLILGGASAFAATTICGAVLGTFKAGYAKS